VCCEGGRYHERERKRGMTVRELIMKKRGCTLTRQNDCPMKISHDFRLSLLNGGEVHSRDRYVYYVDGRMNIMLEKKYG